MKLSDYDNIIFDLGGVILNLNYDQTVTEFQKYIPNFDVETFLGKVKQLSFYSDYEVGKISTEQFKKSFEEHYQVRFQDSEFRDCWNAMLFDFPVERLNLLKRLKSEKKTFLLSNINGMHEIAVDEKYSTLKYEVEFRSLFDKVYYSHHVGLRKPDTKVFELVIDENNLSRERTLFIDDSVQHIVGARKVGIDAFHLQKSQKLEDLELFSDLNLT